MKQAWLRRIRQSHHTLGIEITDHHVKLCEVIEKKGQFRVTQFRSALLPKHTVQDGHIINFMQLQETIKELITAEKIGTKYVHFAIPSQMVMTRMLKLPDLSHHELRKLVQFEMKHNLHTTFEQPYFDFVKMPKLGLDTVESVHTTNEAIHEAAATVESNTNLCDVLVVAAPLEPLKLFTEMFYALKLVPCSYELKAFSLLRLIEQSAVQQGGVWIFVDVNTANCEMTVVEDGVFRITRNVEVSFHSRDVHLFESAAQELLAELERVMNFYDYTLNKTGRPVAALLLSGDIPDMDMLANTLESSLSQQIIRLEWQELFGADLSQGMDLSAFAVTLGLALRGRA